MSAMAVRALFALTFALSVTPAVQNRPELAARFPVPDGYRIVDEDHGTGVADFVFAKNVTGDRLHRVLEARDGVEVTPLALAQHFAARLRAQGGVMFADRINNGGGRLEGRIPGGRPVWLHVDIADNGRSADVVTIEQEPGATAPALPVEETHIPGTWTVNENLDAMAAADRAVANAVRNAAADLVAPMLAPYLGWAWRAQTEDLADVSLVAPGAFPYRIHIYGLMRSQECATCPVLTDTHGVTLVRLEVNRVEALGERDQATLVDDGIFLEPELGADRRLFTRAGRPPLWVPVTREQYLRARIRFVEQTGGSASKEMDASVADFEAGMKELEKTNPAAAKQARAEFAAARALMRTQTGEGTTALRQELDSLSAADRSAAAADPVGHRVVRINPAYFENGRARTAIHFLVVDVPSKRGVGELSVYQAEQLERLLGRVNFASLLR